MLKCDTHKVKRDENEIYCVILETEDIFELYKHEVIINLRQVRLFSESGQFRL